MIDSTSPPGSTSRAELGLENQLLRHTLLEISRLVKLSATAPLSIEPSLLERIIRLLEPTSAQPAARFPLYSPQSWCLELLQDGHITLTKARQWLSRWVECAEVGPLPEASQLGKSIWTQFEDLQAEIIRIATTLTPQDVEVHQAPAQYGNAEAHAWVAGFEAGQLLSASAQEKLLSVARCAGKS